LSLANEENNKLNALVTKLDDENRNALEKIARIEKNYASADRKLTEAEHEIGELKHHEEDLRRELASYKTSYQQSKDRVEELEAQIKAERQENQLSKEQYDRNVLKRMQDQKVALDHRHTKQLDDEKEEYERVIRTMKTSYKDALDETSHQVKQLELERNLWHTKYNDLAKGLEERTLKMKADCQKQMQDNFHQFVSNWNKQDPGHYAPGREPPLSQVVNIADLFFRDATDQSPSEASVHNNDNGNARKRSFLGRDGAAYVARRMVSNRDGRENLPPSTRRNNPT